MTHDITVKNSKGKFIRFDGEAPSCGTGWETLRPLPPDLGQGRFYNLACRPGLDLCMSHCRFIRDYQARIFWAEPRISFVFCVSGATRTRSQDRTSSFEIHAGQADILYFEQPVLERLTAGGRDLKAVVIHFSPGLLAELLFPDPDACNVPALARSLGDGSRFSARDMDFSMQSIVFQMFACPYQDAVRRIYLESKAMELAALTLSQASDAARPVLAAPVREDERQRIIDARDILVSRLQYPPTLPDLACRVGISHARLTRGFKKVFGCTVFEYLRRERLAYARMLISTHRMSITRAAFDAGFSSSSHFAHAFYKYYGIRPSAYRLGCNI
ncbi:AraC family transcriptional regulator [uncultured Desulfobacter sp.]|uniref:helix-turn-helix transcriptional regulator n=1 Tax=uncultured Desulfobacter sp. TaxID=240139 RepID=UPI002AAC1B70|nr:AraC family transcriptional regulator [uncultured Desulfobacter sp.]